MSDSNFYDYAALDHPGILAYIFHPRMSMRPAGPDDILIPVADDVDVGACFHVAGKKAPTLLFFHGNGEIVSDYDDLGPLYTRLGINFFVVDYRGYGWSTGTPTVSDMMADSHRIMDFVIQWCRNQGFRALSGHGRSLGSAAAIELAAARSSEVDTLIVESGFAATESLLRALGIDPAALGHPLGTGNGQPGKNPEVDRAGIDHPRGTGPADSFFPRPVPVRCLPVF